MAHVSCQGVLTEIWTGYLRTSQNSSLKVRNFLFTTFLTAFRTASRWISLLCFYIERLIASDAANTT